MNTDKNLEFCTPFYMVYVQGMTASTIKHTDYQEALDEAIRLSKKEDRDVYILKSATLVHPQWEATIIDLAPTIHTINA